MGIAAGMTLLSLTMINFPTNTVSAQDSKTVFLPIVYRQINQNEFYVSVNGSSAGDGSISNPWDLQTALNHPSIVKPGDTIWLREGTYRDQYFSHLKGEPNKTIKVRQYPGERVVLDYTGVMIEVQDSWYVDFWGFEITASNNTRDPYSRPEWAYGVRFNQARESHHIRFINVVVHDVPAQGFGWWIANTDSEIYGSLIYYNGVIELDHGIYTKNTNGSKYMEDNFIFDNASHGIHAYSTTENNLNNFVVIGNTLFNNGSTGFNTSKNSYGVFKRNILIGGDYYAYNPVIQDNMTYYPGSTGDSLNLGYSSGSKNAVISGNYFMGGTFILGGDNSNLTMSGNTIYASTMNGFSQLSFPDNIFTTTKPGGTSVHLRPNQFEMNRANLTIYNWDHREYVLVSADQLSKLPIKPGDTYELRNVQNYFGDRITGIYNGEGIQVPMYNHSVAQPIGLSFKPDSTFPEFGAFVLVINPG